LVVGVAAARWALDEAGDRAFVILEQVAKRLMAQHATAVAAAPRRKLQDFRSSFAAQELFLGILRIADAVRVRALRGEGGAEFAEWIRAEALHVLVKLDQYPVDGAAGQLARSLSSLLAAAAVAGPDAIAAALFSAVEEESGTLG
jgi:hypothetical protein